MQNHYNLLYREEEREMMPLCASEDIGVIPWEPISTRFSGWKPEHRKPRGNFARKNR